MTFIVYWSWLLELMCANVYLFSKVLNRMWGNDSDFLWNSVSWEGSCGSGHQGYVQTI